VGGGGGRSDHPSGFLSKTAVGLRSEVREKEVVCTFAAKEGGGSGGQE